MKSARRNSTISVCGLQVEKGSRLAGRRGQIPRRGPEHDRMVLPVLFGVGHTAGYRCQALSPAGTSRTSAVDFSPTPKNTRYTKRLPLPTPQGQFPRTAAPAQRTRTRMGGVRRRFGRYRLAFQHLPRRPNSWPGRRFGDAPCLHARKSAIRSAKGLETTRVLGGRSNLNGGKSTLWEAVAMLS